MSKEWKAPDKVTQKMTRDGAVAENLTTGETTSISERPQEENYSQAPTAAAEKAVDRIGAEVERQAAKGAGKKALDAAQLKTHTSRLQFSEAERATPELQKSIRKSEKAADRLDAARAAIRALISKITSAASVTPARRLAPNRYFLRATPGPGICSSPLGTRAWRISQLNAAAVRIAVSQWQLSFARRSPESTSRNLIANFATDVEHVQPAVRYQP